MLIHKYYARLHNQEIHKLNGFLSNLFLACSAPQNKHFKWITTQIECKVRLMVSCPFFVLLLSRRFKICSKWWIVDVFFESPNFLSLQGWMNKEVSIERARRNCHNKSNQIRNLVCIRRGKETPFGSFIPMTTIYVFKLCSFFSSSHRFLLEFCSYSGVSGSLSQINNLQRISKKITQQKTWRALQSLS